MASDALVSVGPGDGLSPVMGRDITWTGVDFYQCCKLDCKGIVSEIVFISVKFKGVCSGLGVLW